MSLLWRAISVDQGTKDRGFSKDDIESRGKWKSK